MSRCTALTASAICTGLVTFALGGRLLVAQPPERPQEVGIPGLGIRLKAGWQLLFHDGCRFAVPLAWQPDPDEAFARAPDGSSISIQMFRNTSWSAHRSSVRHAYAHVKVVHEDSDRRLWLEIGGEPRVQHYIAVADDAGVCAGWLEMRAVGATARDTAAGIANSIGPAGENWPLDDK